MAAKKKGPSPPIDRPLSKAYLREFTGWTTAHPPGQSEPNSLRVMENLYIDRNGAACVRPGLRYLSYSKAPDVDFHESPGTELGLPVVGGFAVFYLNDGTRALLFAVQEDVGGGKKVVGFRAMSMAKDSRPVLRLEDIGFAEYDRYYTPFSIDTTYVHYVQIDNTIIAMSNNGEPARHFDVGVFKRAYIPQEIPAPGWGPGDRLTVMHPDAAWINWLEPPNSNRNNLIPDPSFRRGTQMWEVSDEGSIKTVPLGPETFELEVASLPTNTNFVTSPLHDVTSTGLDGWTANEDTVMQPISGTMQLAPKLGHSDVFWASSRLLSEGIQEYSRYRLSCQLGPTPPESDVEYGAALEFVAVNGAVIGSRIDLTTDLKNGTWVTDSFRAPKEAVAVRLHLAGRSPSGNHYVRFSNIMMCPFDKDISQIIHGDLGADYYWTGAVNASPSVFHPPKDVEVRADPTSMSLNTPYSAKFQTYVEENTDVGTISANAFLEYKSGVRYVLERHDGAPYTLSWDDTSSADLDVSHGGSNVDNRTFVRPGMEFQQVPRGMTLRVYNSLLEPAATTGNYFDGSWYWDSGGSTGKRYYWTGLHDASISIEKLYATRRGMPTAETPTENTLVKVGGATANTYKMAVFYTFENEVGESAPSSVTEIRMQRPWSDWKMEFPNSNGEPAGPDQIVPHPLLAVDQLVCIMPEQVFERAQGTGATRWHLYAASWSDQDPAPITAERVATKELWHGDFPGDRGGSFWYEHGGWQVITPVRTISFTSVQMPQEDLRVNSTYPIRHRYGMTAADRLVLVGDPTEPAGISWTSNMAGQHTSMAGIYGGGLKVLSSGNIHLPMSAVLWQNPQSVDTLTVLCSSEGEKSITYYMQPGSVQTTGTGTSAVMGFEETTNTPGSLSPYGVQVLNNALYRPLDTTLVKSTASNYNINHKPMADPVANMWEDLLDKDRIVSAQLDNRLYYLVHNPHGEVLREGCTGNEIWALDITAENGHWSRLLIQASSISPLYVADGLFMGVTTPKGIFYLDSNYRYDDVVALDGTVVPENIPWRLETNLQGANRAHDAWAHLQQVTLEVGEFMGTLEWGVKGYDMHGRWIDARKQTTVPTIPSASVYLPDSELENEFEDPLLVRRDMKEWFFHASSVPGVHSSGEVLMVQYRYTPTTVNVGYEWGSVETFEYGSPVPGVSRNGVPQPYSDMGKSWE